MDRIYHAKHIPFCPTRVAQVDQYSWANKDHTERLCENGLSHPIYSCQGDISYTLPLDQYPRIDQVHPQIAASRQPHFGVRDYALRRHLERDVREGRLEGFYH